MAPGPTVDEIMAAISESGYLMEQQVATQLENLSFHVETNFAYIDPDEGKSREMDIRAIKTIASNKLVRISAHIEIIAECKNNSNPFVFIARPKNKADNRKRPEEFIFPYRYEMKKDLGTGRILTKEIDPFHHLGFDEIYSERRNIWKAVQFCRIDRKGSGWHANHGGLYDAVFYPMAKVVTARKAEIPNHHRLGEWRRFWFIFPLIVTSGELMLIDSTETTPMPRPVDHINFVRELKSGNLSGIFSLSFVRQQHLENFIKKVVNPTCTLMADLVDNRFNFLMETDLLWSD